jgi:hypothetical protein
MPSTSADVCKMGDGMSIVWLLLFGFGNLAILGLCQYVFGRREASPPTASLSHEARRTLLLLQQLTGEVSNRVEGNAARLDRLVRELSAIAATPFGATTGSLDAIQGSAKQQELFAAYLRRSGRTMQQHSSRLGVEVSGSNEDANAEGSSTALRCRDDAFGESFDRENTAVREAVGTALAGGRLQPADDRCGDERDAMAFTMCVLPLDGDFKPDGKPFLAAAREISTGGMSFSHTRPLSSPYLAVRMTLAGVQDICLVMDRRHTSPVGPMFVTGGAFVRRLEDGNAWRLLFDFAAVSDIAPVQRRPGKAAKPARQMSAAEGE